MRWTQVFYDGMGRQIETKVESRDIAPYQNTDTFTASDGLGRVTQQSQPLFVDEADVNVFLEYTNPSGVSGVRWTSLTYDGLGRVRTQTDPGGKVTTHTYSIASGNLSDHTLVDAQQHRVHQQSDGLGRLVKVIEDAGTGAWSTYATTSYAYTPLDLLDTATDAQGNVTDLDYDSLGRKTRSVDPDMGTWYYAYDMDGNLVTQTDASQRTQVFNYDALGRLTSRMAEDSGPTSTFADGFDAQSSLNWTWSSYQSVASSMVSSTGSGSGWNAEFSRSSYDLSDGDGLALSLKLSGTNPNAIFAVETGSGAAYRRLQLLVLNGQFGTQTTLDGSNYTTFTPLMSVQANVWYRLTMTLDDRAGFRVQVAQDGAPQTRATQLISMPPGQSWRFHHWIYAANTATIDSYSEYQGPRYGYDQGTNGKGRRTSMALGTGAGALASTSWSYDSRGRVTNTREDVSGLPSSGRSFSRSYDSADRVVSQSFPAANSAAAETLSYAYDAGWRQTSVCSSLGGCYAQSASYLASGQPNAWTLGNGLVQNWMYDVLNRPVRLQLGTSASVSTADNLSAAAADRFDRQYSFDDVGNVLSLTDKRGAQPLQSYVYDARDRLTSWTLGGTTQSYTYDLIGNLTSKAGISQTYGSTGLGSGTGPHQARSVGGATYSYDATGNLISGGGRNIAWNTDNLPYTVTSGGVPEGYLYNADSARVKKVRGSVSTYYLDGMWEEDSTGMVRKYYTLGDQTVASRTVTSTTNAVSYLQGDNLGSVSLTTDASGVAGTPQEFDPWGKVRSGVISATRRNYTGQYLDDTGLLFYNAALRHFLWS
jgi:YD repeat-containing protein